MPTRPSVRQLECLVAVADTLNFHRAASALAMSQPALSAQVLLNCIVPKVVGKKVKAAKKALAKAGCAPPKLKKKGKFVKSQNPKPGTEIPSDRAVVLKRRP